MLVINNIVNALYCGKCWSYIGLEQIFTFFKKRKKKVKRKPKSSNPLTAKRISPTVADFNHDPMALTMCV